jgi:hypothetical protein
MDFKSYVDRLFEEAEDRFDRIRTNPVTGGRWLRGVDRVAPQKRAACRALVVRAWFAWDNPDMPSLPLSYEEREDLKGRGGVGYIVSVYARSLKAHKYDRIRHPPFELYARGVLASRYAPHFLTEGPALRKRFPPRPLPGLGSCLYWDPPKKCRRGRN